jgi:hypothetical protein
VEEGNFDEPQHAGPTDAVFNSWSPTSQKKKNSTESVEAVDASLDAIAGRLDQAASRIVKIINTKFGAEGPGEYVRLIEHEIDSACRLHAFEVLERHNVKPRLASVQRLTSSEARLDAAIDQAKSYAATHKQQIDTRAIIGIRARLDGLLGARGVKREELSTVGPQESSTEDLRASAVTEHVEAALARAEFLRKGINSEKSEDLHTSIEEYTAHLTSAARIANDILEDRGDQKSKLSRLVRKAKDTAMSKLVSEVEGLLAETKGNPKIHKQTKWTDVRAKLSSTKLQVNKL